MCSTDYDVASVYNEKMARATKDHVCTECGRTIKKGESYKNVWGVWVFGHDTYKTCQHCRVAQEWLSDECGGFLHGGLDEEILEHAFEYRKTFLYRWIIGIRRGWKKFNSDGLMPLPKSI